MAASKTSIRLNGSKLLPVTASDTNEFFSVKESYEIAAARGAADAHIVTIAAEDFVELTFSDNTTWIGDSETLKELFPQIKTQSRSLTNAPELPLALQSDDISRSLIGDIALKVFKVLAAKAVKQSIKKVATLIEDKGLEKRAGLYTVGSDFGLTAYKAQRSNAAAKMLLFIHGTASSAGGAFGELKESEVWAEITARYQNNIIAFEHRTLTVGPLQNVEELVSQLPADTTFDVITHSRGGIVGELLMRFSEDVDGFMDQSIKLLNDEGRKDDVSTIKSISEKIKNKKIKINRFIRVACTAAGTSLLSERTDIFLNTLVNLLNLSKPFIPVVGAIKGLIAATIESKNDFSELPGLEAQRPESVLMKIVNTYREYDGNLNPVGFDNKLIVISGNGKFSISLNGLKVILTKFFFKWQQNDLVVDTVSMYKGAKRKYPVQYYLDSGTDTNHFNYFKNKTTRDALRQALFSTADRIPTFKELGNEDFDAVAGRGIFGLDSGRLKPVEPTGKKPVVILLPGIMGSFLDKHEKPLWINYLRFAVGGLLDLEVKQNDGIQATGIIKTAYNDLAEYLSNNFDVLVFPFDWRKPLTEAGAQLNAVIVKLFKLKQTILLAGHSMGGLVIRDLIINYSATWKTLNAQPGFRTLLLGTPWLGSYRIPHVLSGKDSIIKQLNLIDIMHGKATLINMFSRFQGLLNLLPIHGDIDFGSKKVWDDFRSASGINIDSIPDEFLKNFSEYSKLVKKGIENIDYTNIIYIAGKDDETVKEYKIENGNLQFYSTAEGDQSVTWESGIPKQINRETSLYYTNASHGALAKKSFLFKGFLDLLTTGTTAEHEFSRVPIQVSEKDRSFASKEEYLFDSSESTVESNILGLDSLVDTEETNTPILNVSVSKGDMMFAKYPVMIGHFDYDDIYSAESIANKYLDNSLLFKHRLGLYPGTIGSSEFFHKTNGNKDFFPGAIIVGLGQSETLNANQLTLTVEKAVSDYLITYKKDEVDQQKNNAKNAIGLSSLLIGAGYGGLPVEGACRAILLGIIRANEKVVMLTGMQDLYVSEVEFIELFEDRSISCFNSINTLIIGNSDGMNLGWAEKLIRENPGGRKRLLADVSNEWWQRLSVIANNVADGAKTLSFYSSTNNAREEKNEMGDNIRALENIYEDISTNGQWSFDKAKTLFEILIPNDFKENIRRNAPVMWVLDKYTAAFPWELLQTGTAAEKPLCISAGMIRQLATSTYRRNNTQLKDNNVLVIGDPNLDGFSKAQQLPGAAREAKEVYELLKGKGTKKSGGSINLEPPLINRNSGEILVGLYKQNYRIIHIAAHGFFDAENPRNSGVLIGKVKDKDEPVFLTPEHIVQLPGIPELVFINCCFLGKVNPYAEELSNNRYQLAANIGTALIESGVKAVIVAGWEVDDGAAVAFSKKFYEEMLRGGTFGDAVLSARRYIYDNFRYTNTWGAFQCYGQPQFSLTIGSNEQVEFTYNIPQHAENDLDNLISKSEVPFYKDEDLMEDLKKISKGIAKAKFDGTNLKQLEAKAYIELNDYSTAIEIYNELFKAEKANFNVSSLEAFQDIRVKQAMIEFISAGNLSGKIAADKIGIIDESINNLDRLLSIWVTAERFSLIASANKRKARMIDGLVQKKKVMALSASYYYSAYRILNDSYSFCNWLTMRIFLEGTKPKWTELYFGKEPSDKNGRRQANSVVIDRQYVKDELRALEKKVKKNKNQSFWELTQQIDIMLCHFLLEPGKKANLTGIQNAFERVWKKMGSKNKKMRQWDNIELMIHFAEITKQNNIKKGLDKLKELLGKL
ncbi:MAG: CHAT domain-containing protein [Agriterribacter sp.]